MQTRNILFIVYPGFELLDLSGPVSVFSSANSLTEISAAPKHSAPSKYSPYAIYTASRNGGLVVSSSSVAVQTIAIDSIVPSTQDTILVVGAGSSDITAAGNDSTLINWLRTNCLKAERYGSICSGTFLLGAANLLDQRQCTTHWAACRQLEKRHPRAKLLSDSLYVIDDKLWTSAGVTTGLDMALEMLRRDLGNTIMTKIAKLLVVYAHRPGNQSQFSPLLSLQAKADKHYSDLLAWIENNLECHLKVADLADYMCMTERTFYRKFTAAFAITPSKYLEEVRLDRAKQLLENKLAISQVATAIGFKSEAAFRTRFEARFGLTPSMYKRLHAGEF